MAGLSGMKQITDHCNRSESTILKWIRELGFPAVKLRDSTWESDTELIAEWRRGQIRAATTANGSGKENGPLPARGKMKNGRRTATAKRVRS